MWQRKCFTIYVLSSVILWLALSQNIHIWEMFWSHSNKSNMQKLSIDFTVHNFEISVEMWVRLQYLFFEIKVCYVIICGMLLSSFVGIAIIGSVCAIAASKKSLDSVSFVKTIRSETLIKSIFDKYSHCILEGGSYMKGNIWNLKEWGKMRKSTRNSTKQNFLANLRLVIYSLITQNRMEISIILPAVIFVMWFHKFCTTSWCLYKQILW